ncbi:hypothetical protein MMAN_35750 [Mycobacterium mantenii]|uniref:DUF7159 domain-containing protein n=1 Tax=Mycobacterium mantenii TaxID=560555 RepID=A0A1X0F7X9_MYCNT|nr:hypothetical protein [Mycobacterium mantenii]MCV7242518.1 hypothetical protein [Mycobacterium mantenii]ORA97547.1 hypothetical protein BST30_26950 [Mycobacterium mantenii]BBY39441.1 hypothetical protein MMAN_35750 [Mycobacterium mantenii]
MDIVLGVSMAPRTVRLVAIEGQNADGVTVEQEEFAVGAVDNSAAGAVDQVIDAIIGSREGVMEGGHRLASTGVTWSDPAGVGALRDAIASHELGGVMLVAPLLAAAALAQTVGYALGYERLAMLFVEPANATLAVVDVADGSIVDLHRRQTGDGGGGGLATELAAMVSGLDARGSPADGVFLVGCGTDIVALKSTLEGATSLPVIGPEDPDMALARGAALASANAPLFASSTAALAYALDPGTGEMNPPALSPTYLDVWGHADVGTDARAYSAVPDEDDRPPRRPWSMVLAGSALAGIAAVIGGVVLVTLTSDRPGPDVGHHAGVSVATPRAQLPAAPPSSPPQAQLPAPSPAPPPPAPAPSPSEVAAPAPAPSPVQQAAPQTPVNPPPAAPVHRAPSRPAPQYVPPPVEQAAPPPAAAPAPPPAAPPPPPAAPRPPSQPPVTMYLHFPFVTVPIPITPPPPPGQ